jgi:hypothetical protein
VNPLLSDYVLREYQPRVVFVVRHPAGVASSWRERGWWPSVDEHIGAILGLILRQAWESLRDYDDCSVIAYEDLCVEPVRVFEALFDFADLEWDAAVEHAVRESASGGDHEHPGSTIRNSQAMAKIWRERVTTQELLELRAGYRASHLPWYANPEDW